jgi:hypothetical protein
MKQLKNYRELHYEKEKHFSKPKSRNPVVIRDGIIDTLDALLQLSIG